MTQSFVNFLKLMRSPWAPIVTCLGLGYSPVASGTVASFFAALFWYYGRYSGVGEWGLVAMTLVLTLAGIWAIRQYEKEKASEDASEIVIDEWVGMGISVWFLPLDWPLWVAAFFLFRLFDIWKPPGAKYFDNNHLGGAGVMLDDVVAGLYAFLVLGAYQWFIA